MDMPKEHLNKKYPLYKKRYELVTTCQQGKTNVAWTIRVKTGMCNAEHDKVTAEEFMLSWVVAFNVNLCREKKLTWELFEEIAASSGNTSSFTITEVKQH